MATDKTAGICSVMPKLVTVLGHLIDSEKFKNNIHRRIRKSARANFFIHNPASKMVFSHNDQVQQPHTMVFRNDPAPSDRFKGVAPELYLY